MNKNDIVEILSSRTTLSKKQAREAVEALFSPMGGMIAETLKTGQKVTLTGFGTFEAKERKERKGRNPRTGKSVDIPATVAPAFRPGQSLKEVIAR